MNRQSRMLAIITARGGSIGLPGKNIRRLAGLPLIAHSILLAKRCPEIDRCIVSTDSKKIAKIAKRCGGDVPFMRPSHLARANTPSWPVLRHALAMVEAQEGQRYDYLLLLEPTSPTRLPEDVRKAYRRLKAVPTADGIVSVSKPPHSPFWHTVINKNGWMKDLIRDASRYTRRQDLPEVYDINGLIYLWRTRYLRAHAAGAWRVGGRHLLFEVPSRRATSIDDVEEFVKIDLLIRNGYIRLPWLKH